MFRSRKRKDRWIEAQARRLVCESEAFLAGRYAHDLQRQGMPVPTWAWISELAHAPVEQMLAPAPVERGMWMRDHTAAQWQNAVVLLAHELVTAARHTGCSVEELQQAIVVEVELEYSPLRFGAWAAGPGLFVCEVRRTLGQFRARPRS